MNDATISSELPLRLLSHKGGVLPLDAVIIYNTADPLAVSTLFDTGAEKPVRWTFARDLLSEGLHRRVGDGDMAVWPAVDDTGEPALNLRLSSPDGDALIEAPAGVVEDFLARTAEVVPFGDEELQTNVDAALEAILGGIA